MDYIQNNLLTEQQTKAILDLQETCFAYEGLSNKPFLSNELNCNKEFPCFYLAYEKEKLVSFLTCFLPSPVEAEVNGFTHPSYRNKGLFSALLDLAQKTLMPHGYERFLLQVEPQSKKGVSYIAKRFPTIERTEYRLSLKKSEWAKKDGPHAEEINLEQINKDNVPIYARISAKVFNETLEQSTAYSMNIENNPDRDGYLCYCKDEPIGVFNMHYEEPLMAVLYGIGIIPPFRGKGLGKEMVSLGLELLFEKVEIVYLDVDSENPNAGSLYRKLGFSTAFQVDYHTLLLA
jgi:ribosomal protein S18 acetylase RimI-like enzyme